jgi:hypothetical protein
MQHQQGERPMNSQRVLASLNIFIHGTKKQEENSSVGGRNWIRVTGHSKFAEPPKRLK